MWHCRPHKAAFTIREASLHFANETLVVYVLVNMYKVGLKALRRFTFR
jgi:hypothetical protein